MVEVTIKKVELDIPAGTNWEEGVRVAMNCLRDPRFPELKIVVFEFNGRKYTINKEMMQ